MTMKARFARGFVIPCHNHATISLYADHQSGSPFALHYPVLSLLQDNPRLIYAELTAQTGKPQRTFSRVLDALKRKGLITWLEHHRSPSAVFRCPSIVSSIRSIAASSFMVLRINSSPANFSWFKYRMVNTWSTGAFTWAAVATVL